MFGSTVLEVAIGLVLVYLLLSLVCSAINEFVARIFAWRSSTLKQGILKLLDDLQISVAGNNVAVKDRFYDDPLLRGLQQGRAKPSYIPAKTFVQALLNIVAPSQPAAMRDFTSIRAAIAGLPASTMKTSLLGLIDTAAGDLKIAHQNLERWFDDSMAEVSAWYQRWANTWLFIFALVVCAVTNADSVQIANQLWRDPTLRATVIKAAEEAAKKPPPEANQGTSTALQIAEIQKEFNSLQIPLGWKQAEFDAFIAFDRDWGPRLEKLFGIVFTTLAVSLGAPFWFDLLNKLINFRAAAKKPERSNP